LSDPNEEEEGPKAHVDGLSALMVATGIPGIFMFLVLLFVAVMIWDIPA
jgi:hypothetical protein